MGFIENNVFLVANGIIWLALLLLVLFTFFRTIIGKSKLNWIMLVLLNTIWFFEPVLVSELNAIFLSSSSIPYTFHGMIRELLSSIFYSTGIFAAAFMPNEVINLHNIFDNHECVRHIFLAYGYAVFCICPILTFDFIISQFTQTKEKLNCFWSLKTERHIFSELNENSISLAESIKKTNKELKIGTQIIFTDVYKQNNENTENLLARAKNIKAVCLKNDVVHIRPSLRFIGILKKIKSDELKQCFYYISNDETENLSQINEMSKNKFIIDESTQARLYLFSQTTISSIAMNEMLDKDKKNLQIRRINPSYYAMIDFLYNEGHKLFDNAFDNKETGKKEINASIIGFGNYGKILTKMLLWYCTMDGYKLNLNIFDKKSNIESEFNAMARGFSNKNIDLSFFPNTDINGQEFMNTISSLKKPTFFFVATGNDEKSLSTAINIRRLTLRADETNYANIYSIVKSTEKDNILKTNNYGINLIGDTKSLYSYNIIVKDDIVDKAYDCHNEGKVNIDENANINYDKNCFYSDEYNFTSSIAIVLHWKLRKYLINKLMKKYDVKSNELFDIIRNNQNNIALTDSEQEIYDNFFTEMTYIEKDRWNSFVQCEGYIYCSKEEIEAREATLSQYNHNKNQKAKNLLKINDNIYPSEDFKTTHKNDLKDEINYTKGSFQGIIDIFINKDNLEWPVKKGE